MPNTTRTKKAIIISVMLVALLAPVSRAHADIDKLIGLAVSMAVSYFLPGAGLIEGILSDTALIDWGNFIISSAAGGIASADYRSCSFNIVWSSSCDGGSSPTSIPADTYATSESCTTEGCTCYGPTNSCSKNIQGTVAAVYDGEGGLAGYKCIGSNGADLVSAGPPPETTCTPVCSALSGQACNSAANSCGMVNSATYTCSGTCDVAGPPADTQCAPPKITIGYKNASGVLVSAQRQLVSGGSGAGGAGGRCTINWSVGNATSCTLTAPGGGVIATGLSGEVKTPPINQSTVFTLTCMNGSVVSNKQAFACQLAPDYKED